MVFSQISNVGKFRTQKNMTLGNVTSYRRFFVGLFIFLVVSISLIISINLYPSSSNINRIHKPLDLSSLDNIPDVILKYDVLRYKERNPNCTYWDCFNVYRCGQRGRNQISVYVYPIKHYLDESGNPITKLSKEFYYILDHIIKSKYYTPEPDEACILVPSIDILNQNSFKSNLVEQALNSLSTWNNGENHLLFNMLPGSSPDFNTVVDLSTGNALIAGAGFDTWTFRSDFDVSIPIYSPEAETLDPSQPSTKLYLIISSQINLYTDHITDLQYLASSSEDLLLLENCSEDPSMTNYSVRCQYKNHAIFNYPSILKYGSFCVVVRSVRLAQSTLMDALAAGCIPVVIADSIIMPFAPLIDWNRAALFIPEDDISSLINIVKTVSSERRNEMALQTRWLYDKYFASMDKITETTLDIINEQAFPLMGKGYDEWNLPQQYYGPSNPLFLPVTAPKAMGFTAVILTYDRIESLFTLIKKLVKTPSLTKVLVIWNNQKKDPPPSSQWPTINKPLKVIQTKENKLSNRFYPYAEIETECLLTIDDDIVMLTPDELEFGYEVWREYPDRIVGFPSRVHMWDNVTQSWKYQSEWTNEISMVLTGAAFHHKIWSWYYTMHMPEEIRQWVDERFNCEDIAMNFLVANVTNKAPIKVAPRKKFKCPECTNREMLSADLGHMTTRSECIDRFTKIYGKMALKSVEFRADPVLYKDNFPPKLKRYNDIGSL